MKKKILIVYTEMILGGATTSLISLLNSFDYSHYFVDLLLYENDGCLQNRIPKEVTVLEQARIKKNKFLYIAQRLSSLNYLYSILKSFYYKVKTGNKLVSIQVMSAAGARFSRVPEKEYDLEFWPLNYNSRFVKARYKIAWIHIDYLGSGLIMKLDEPAFNSIDRIILVSEECLNNFKKLCPKYSDRAICIENLISQSQVYISAEHVSSFLLPKNENTIRFVTTCRIIFSHKGLDRGVKAFTFLRNKGLINNVEWYIIGDGEDMSTLKRMIKEKKLEKHIILLGSRTNPLGYVSECDFFFLPSIYEGKPLAVTEALILGLPAIVTNYESAKEQVENYVDGLVVENSVDGIIKGLETLINNPDLRKKMKREVSLRDYSNTKALNKFNNVLEASILVIK